jgi:hypothetical protein
MSYLSWNVVFIALLIRFVALCSASFYKVAINGNEHRRNLRGVKGGNYPTIFLLPKNSSFGPLSWREANKIRKYFQKDKKNEKIDKIAFYGQQNANCWVCNTHGRFCPLPPPRPEFFLAKLRLWKRACNGVCVWSIDYRGKSNVELLSNKRKLQSEHQNEKEHINRRNRTLVLNAIC